MTRILLADDHALVRKGIAGILALAPELRVVAEAADGWAVLEGVRAGGLDLLLLDLTMPGPSGVELIKRVRDLAPRLPVLVITMHGESQIASRAIKAGAAGYLTKDSEPQTLIEAVRRVAAGRHFIDPGLAARLVFDTVGPEGEAPHGRLSDREYEVLRLLAAGRATGDIAAALHISPKTVSTHKFRLMRKLGVASLAELVRYALRHGLVDGAA